MAQVRLENVCKRYASGVTAVENFSLSVADGEFIVLVGPSGCGKSTTLRMIAGLEEISSGSVYIGDRLVNNVLPKERDIAMVFQNYALYPDKTVFENMAFCLRIRKDAVPAIEGGWLANRRHRKEEIDRRVREAADILGITELLDRKPAQLSGGQRQRVALGRCIVRQPSVFLFDEPLSNLDAKMRVQMRTEISRLHSKLKATMIYVTHDQVEAMTMGDRIVVMKAGKIQQIDTPANIYNKPTNTFVAGFIGTPPMNLISGRIVNEGNVAKVACECGIELAVNTEFPPSTHVTIGIRPEQIGSPQAESDNDAQNISGIVEFTEPLGAETYVHFNVSSQSIVARLSPDHHYSPGEKLSLPVSSKSIHIWKRD